MCFIKERNETQKVIFFKKVFYFSSFKVVRYVSGIALNPKAYRWVILFVMEHESRSSSWVWVGGLQISHKFYGPFNFL